MTARVLFPALGIVALVYAQEPPAKLTQAEAETAVHAILPELESIRGLKFKTNVPVTVIDDRRAREYALKRFRSMTPDAKIRADQTAYALLGLVPPELDLLKTLLDVLEEQAGGFYDPDTKSFYLLDDMPKEATALLAAHEMTHALEDQRYDLDGRIAKLVDDDDASFALSALIEGSATVAAATYVAKGIAAGTLTQDQLVAMGGGVASVRLDALPEVMRRQLLGPYVLGAAFLAQGNVDAAWTRPPRSSEQILHPDKYWNPKLRDDPKRVTIPDPSRTLGDGWTRAGSGVLGELTLGSLVAAATPKASELVSGSTAWTNAAASGWGGDRFELWTHGEAAVVLLATVWDTAKDAFEFAAALPPDRAGFAHNRVGTKVGIIAGAGGDRRDALLKLLVKP